MLDDARVAAVLADAAGARAAAEALVAAAVEAGGRDNATAVVVDVLGLVPDEPDDPTRRGRVRTRRRGPPVSDERRRSRRSYRPGEWYAVFGDRATVLLPPTQRSRVAQLWPLLDDGAGFDEVLDALIATGLRGLPGFVLVSESDDETRIVLRGAARAVLSGAEGDVELEGSAATTWVERSVHGVTRLVVEVGPGDALARGGDDGAAAEPLAVHRRRRGPGPPRRPAAVPAAG